MQLLNDVKQWILVDDISEKYSSLIKCWKQSSFSMPCKIKSGKFLQNIIRYGERAIVKRI